MRATGKFRAALLVFVFSLFAAGGAHPQGTPLTSNPPAINLSVNRLTSRPDCAETAGSGTSALWRFERFGESARFADGFIREGTGFAGACASGRPEVRLDRQCTPPGPAGISLDSPPCVEAPRPTARPLVALGKEGIKISEAREQVFGILTAANACTEWFQTKDPFPAQTLRSLNFQVDRHGQAEILESASEHDSGVLTFRHPYVAWAIQDGGPFTTITINAYGAFYRAQGRVERTSPDGGPSRIDGMRSLTVGTYTGDTLAAQMVTLLHELGHIVDLLPQDGDDLDGSSIRNTNEVLRHCRGEVDARAHGARPAKSHDF